jgi:hypothetical protein
MTLISCTSDLDVTPGDDDEFYLKLSFKIQHHTNKKQNYTQDWWGNDETDQDIAGLGGDFSSYLRLLFLQELPQTKQHCLGRWYFTNNEYSNFRLPMNFSGNFQEHFMK